MPKAKKLDPDHFNRPPVLNMKTSEQKFMYEGLRAFSDDEGILEHDIQFLILRIFGDNRRYKHFLSNMSALEKLGAIVRYESDGKKYIVLPHHFDIEGRIQYFSPTIHSRPPLEFYKKYQHYAKELKIHLGWVGKSLEDTKGSQGVAIPPLTTPARPRVARGTPDHPCLTQGSQGVPRGAKGGPQSLGELIPETLKDLNVRFRSKKRLKDVQEKEVIKGKGESLKGEKGKSGEEENIDLRRILAVCGDKKSANFYKLVLKKCPQKIIKDALIETKCAIQENIIQKSPGAYFTGLIIKFAGKQGIRLKK
jgi:hypothetical protein